LVRPRQASDEAILLAARACFLEHGPKVSVAQIAAEVGLSGPALFKRFGSKQELMISALVPTPEMFPDLTPPDHGSLAPQVRHMAEQVMGAIQVIGPCIAVLRSAGIDHKAMIKDRFEGPPPAFRKVTGWFAALEDHPEVKRHRVKDFGLTFLSNIHGYVIWGFIMNELLELPPVDDYLDQVVHLTVAGLTTAEIA